MSETPLTWEARPGRLVAHGEAQSYPQAAAMAAARPEDEPGLTGEGGPLPPGRPDRPGGCR